MKRTVKTEAIVLSKRPLPNQDKIVTIFTKELGKIRTYAKGIKKLISRRLPHIQTANLITVVLYHINDSYYLQESTLISGFSELKKDRVKLENLYRFFFIIEKLLPDNQSEPDIYNLTKNYLITLSRSKNQAEELTAEFLNESLRLLGYSKDKKSLSELIRITEEIIHEKVPDLHL